MSGKYNLTGNGVGRTLVVDSPPEREGSLIGFDHDALRSAAHGQYREFVLLSQTKGLQVAFRLRAAPHGTLIDADSVDRDRRVLCVGEFYAGPVSLEAAVPPLHLQTRSFRRRRWRWYC